MTLRSLIISNICVFIFLVFATNVLAQKDIRIIDLRCDYGTNPLGIDSASPRLSWKIESKTNGERQTAYQILAASSEKQLAENEGDLWDSGKSYRMKLFIFCIAARLCNQRRKFFGKCAFGI